MNWIKRSAEVDLGLLPMMLHEADPRPAREQLDTGYAHGGGWRPFKGFEFGLLDGKAFLKYPGDPIMHSVAYTQLREEVVILFEHDWVVICRPNNDWEVARMD